MNEQPQSNIKSIIDQIYQSEHQTLKLRKYIFYRQDKQPFIWQTVLLHRSWRQIRHLYLNMNNIDNASIVILISLQWPNLQAIYLSIHIYNSNRSKRHHRKRNRVAHQQQVGPARGAAHPYIFIYQYIDDNRVGARGLQLLLNT